MAAPPGLTVHVCQASTRASSICVHRKRRSESPRADRLREGPSEVTPSHSVRVERRGGGFLGRTSFVTIHTRPTVAREPSLEVYRAVREARKVLLDHGPVGREKGLLHAWEGHHQCQIVHLLGADFCVPPFANALELCVQTSQKHSSVCEESARSVSVKSGRVTPSRSRDKSPTVKNAVTNAA